MGVRDPGYGRITIGNVIPNPPDRAVWLVGSVLSGRNRKKLKKKKEKKQAKRDGKV